mmetsp:Transcript_14926/g.38134  ORF Transcript_14926/g.38134 Transcript_14926/m.38134 type:complete len:205 (+) Transcript_14926:1410-2024(+)
MLPQIIGPLLLILRPAHASLSKPLRLRPRKQRGPAPRVQHRVPRLPHPRPAPDVLRDLHQELARDAFSEAGAEGGAAGDEDFLDDRATDGGTEGEVEGGEGEADGFAEAALVHADEAGLPDDFGGPHAVDGDDELVGFGRDDVEFGGATGELLVFGLKGGIDRADFRLERPQPLLLFDLFLAVDTSNISIDIPVGIFGAKVIGF